MAATPAMLLSGARQTGKTTLGQAIKEVIADRFEYIEIFYNRQRRHSHLGQVSPAAFEKS